MKILKQILSLIALAIIVTSCYDPIEIKTDDVTKVDIPFRVAMPLADGNLFIEYDSLVDFSALGNDILTYEGNKAYLSFDTVIDFYAQMSDLLSSTDIDLSTITAYSRDFPLDADVNMTDYTVYGQVLQSGFPPQNVDSTIELSLQDSFKTKYGATGVYFDIGEVREIKVDGISVHEKMTLNSPYDVYRITMESGRIVVDFDPSEIPTIPDDSMTVEPQFRYVDAAAGIDTIIKTTEKYNIADPSLTLPQGVTIKAVLEIPSIKAPNGANFEETMIITDLDTVIDIDLAGYYYESLTGDAEVEVIFNNWIEIDQPDNKAMVPLVDTLTLSVLIEDLVFESVLFDYGRNEVVDSEQEFDFSLGNKIQLVEALDIEGLRIADPDIKIKLRSNIGFAAMMDVKEFALITDEGNEDVLLPGNDIELSVAQPADPGDLVTVAESSEDSVVIDSTTSRLSEIDILDVTGIYLDYEMIVNPNDEAGQAGKHNFFYIYNEANRDDMYDVVLTAEARMPVAFQFDDIKVIQTIGSPFNADSTARIDSVIYMDDEDSVNFNAMFWTTNFPLEMTAQIYFDIIDGDGLTHIDSMFSTPAIILPSSPNAQIDSTSWSVSLDLGRYESLKESDSLTMVISLSMDEQEYIQLVKGDYTEIAYKFQIGNSTFNIKNQ